jgi:hypothetical protein
MSKHTEGRGKAESRLQAWVGRDRQQETDFDLSVRSITSLAENQESKSTSSRTRRATEAADGGADVSVR